MRQAAGLAVLLSLVVLTAASAATRGGVPGAAFVGNDGEDFGLVSNSQWLANGKPVHSVQTIRAANPKSSSPEEVEPLQTIWASTCLREAQVVRFTRHVFVAGPLWKLGVFVGGAQPHPAFFKSFEVLINHRTVLHANGGGGGFDPTEAKGSVVHWGDNLFEIVVVKKPFTRGYACRKGGSGRTGVSFVIRGGFANDLSFPNPARDDYFKGGSAVYQLNFGITIRNNGPGGLGAGVFTITLDAPEGQLSDVSELKLPAASLPIVGCTEKRDGREYRRFIKCALANMKRGATVTPSFSFKGTTPNSRDDVRITVMSFVSGGNQIGNGRDNYKTDVVTFCGNETTNPKCPK